MVYAKHTFVFALGHLVGPHADTGITIVGQTGRALISGGFTVPAVPEHIAFVLIGEDAVQAGTVWRGDWRFYRDIK